MAVSGWWDAAVGRVGRGRMMLGAGATLVVLGAVVGYALGVAQERQAAHERHAATAAVLTGTVIWSNQMTRLIVFEQDGVARRPNDNDTIYYVIGYAWRDAEGNYPGGTYPTCLAGHDGDEVSDDRHRVALTALDWDTGGAHHTHIAVQVQCLD